MPRATLEAMNDDEHPELAGYEPIPERPLRRRNAHAVMRVVVVLAIIGLILPGVLITITTASNTAERSCAIYIDRLVPGSQGQVVRFEMTSPIGPGYNCYSVGFGGDLTLVHAFGLIPVGVAPAPERIIDPEDA